MRTSSRDVVCLVFDEIELYELAAFAQCLSLAGRHWNWRPFKLHVVGKAELVRSTSSLCLSTTCRLAQSPNAEVLFIPGGYGARLAMRDSELVEFVRTQAAAAELTVTVAQGGLLLAMTGLIEGKELALSPSHQRLLGTDIEQQSALSSVRASTSSLCVSENLVSAAHSAASVDASLWVVERLLGKAIAQRVKQDLGLLGPTRHF